MREKKNPFQKIFARNAFFKRQYLLYQKISLRLVDTVQLPPLLRVLLHVTISYIKIIYSYTLRLQFIKKNLE